MEHEKELHAIKRRIDLSMVIGIASFVIALVVCLWPWFFVDEYKFNEFGDFVGGVAGTIVSLGTAAFVYMTFQSQRREILLQQIQIGEQEKKVNTEKERAGREKLLSDLDDRFFTILKLHNDAVASLDIVSNRRTLARGRDCLRYILNKLKKTVTATSKDRTIKIMKDGGTIANLNQLEIADVLIVTVLPKYPNDIDIYLKSLVSVCRHLTKMDDEKMEIQEYTTLFRSQLSISELCILHYITLAETSPRTDLQILVSKYIKRFGLLLELTNNPCVVDDFKLSVVLGTNSELAS